jgi:GTP diphosphokinase / guanosine-3',5'-bis(diphosphate) 3'-diphosphatase
MPRIRNCARRRGRLGWCRRCCRAVGGPRRSTTTTCRSPAWYRAYTFAGCCHPVPGDEIVGIVTTGKGVTIHGRECQTLTAFAATPERYIDIDWNYEAVGKTGAAGKSVNHTARISAIAANEQSALADLANAIAKQEGSVINLKIVNRQQDFMEILIDVDVRDIAHLSKVIVGLRGLKTIKGVERSTGG